MAEDGLANLWSVKTILRGFVIMSGLRVKFHKRNIYGVNVGKWYLDAASTFLVCKVDNLPIKFLSVRMGDSPRNISMWRDLISHLKRRLVV